MHFVKFSRERISLALCFVMIVMSSGCASKLSNSAIRNKYTEAEKIINEGTTQKDLNDSLHFAIIYGRLDFAKLLIENGADVNSYWGNSPKIIDAAAGFGSHASTDERIALIELLSEHNVDLDLRGTWDFTALYQTVHDKMYKHNKIDYDRIVKILLEKGANPELRGSIFGVKFSPLEEAAKRGYFGCAKLLLDHGAFPCGWDEDGKLPIETAEENSFYNIVELLTAYGGRREIAIDKKAVIDSPIHYAVLECDEVKVKKLINDGVDPNEKISDGTTPLHMASLLGKKNIFDFIVTQNVNINQVNQSGYTPLFFALQQKHVEIAEDLIAKGASFKNVTNDGRNVLHFAAMCGGIDIIKQIIDSEPDIDINAVDSRGRSPLYYAALNKNYNAAKFLITKNGVTTYTQEIDFSLEAVDEASVAYTLANIYEVMAEDELLARNYSVAREYFDKSSSFYNDASGRYKIIAEDMDAEIFTEKLSSWAGAVGNLAAQAVVAGAVSAAINSAANNIVHDLRKDSLWNQQMAEFRSIEFASETNTGIEGYSKALPVYMEYYNEGGFKPNLDKSPNNSSSNKTAQRQVMEARKAMYQMGVIEKIQHDYEFISEKCNEKALLYQNIRDCLHENSTEEMIHKCVSERIENWNNGEIQI